MSAEIACIGLGANLGDRRAAIEGAVARLRRLGRLSVDRISALYETTPVGVTRQPPFLNAAAVVRASCGPRALLEALHSIEAAHGRDRSRETRFGPRRLDLDLLLYGARVVEGPGLVVPHPRMHERLFVLVPLAEIAPDAVHPGLRLTIAQLRDRLLRPGAEYGAVVECSRERSAGRADYDGRPLRRKEGRCDRLWEAR